MWLNNNLTTHNIHNVHVLSTIRKHRFSIRFFSQFVHPCQVRSLPLFPPPANSLLGFSPRIYTPFFVVSSQKLHLCATLSPFSSIVDASFISRQTAAVSRNIHVRDRTGTEIFHTYSICDNLNRNWCPLAFNAHIILAVSIDSWESYNLYNNLIRK